MGFAGDFEDLSSGRMGLEDVVEGVDLPLRAIHCYRGRVVEVDGILGMGFESDVDIGTQGLLHNE